MEIVNLNFAPDLSGLTNEFDIFEKGGGFDLGKLFTYFDIKIAIRERNEQASRYINVDFRLCKAEDFIKRGIKVNNATIKQYEQMLCPNFDNHSDLVRVRNIYDNKADRVSFSMEIYRCKSSRTKRCQSTFKVDRFFSQIYFTMYTLVERIDFSEENVENNK